MPAPGVQVNVAARRAARGTRLATATTFVMDFAEKGPYDTPTEVTTLAEFAATFGDPTAYAIGSQATELILALGGASVIFVRAGGPLTGRTDTEDNHATATDADWLRAADSIGPQFGLGQLVAPGQTSAAFLSGLQTRAAASGRFAILDAPETDVLATLTAYAATVVNDPGSQASTLAGWTALVPDGAGGDREMPGSVHLAGVIAAADRETGTHVNVQPIGTAAGVGLTTVSGLTHRYTRDEQDTLYDLGVSVADVETDAAGNGLVYVRGVRTLAVSSPEWRQIGWWRQLQSLAFRLRAVAASLGGGVDGVLSGQDALDRIRVRLTGPVSDDYKAGALYGDTDADAYEVLVDATPAELAEGLVTAAVEVRLAPGLERAVINVSSIPIA